MNNMDLSGKTALVTGGSQGLGKAICQKLSSAGANVIVNFFDDPAGQNKIKAEKTMLSLSSKSIALAAYITGQVMQINSGWI